MKAVRLVLLLAVLGLAGGCAFGERQAKLGYPPQDSGGVVSSAEAAPAAAGRGTVYVGRFEDIRPDKKVVGHVRNGFGMKTAEVVAQRDVPEWVHEALVDELKVAGYQVVEGAAPTDAAAVSGAIIRVYCDAYFNYDGEVTLRVDASKAGQRIVGQTYTGKGSAGVSWAATGDSYSESLSYALQDALRQFIAELNRTEL